MTDSRILSKVQRLLALAKSSNPNEAAAAAAQAQRLMDEYNVSTVELTTEEDPMQDREHLDGMYKKNVATWKSQLANGVAQHNGCLSYLYEGLTLLTGRQSDILVTRYLYEYCVREIDNLTKHHCRGMGKSYANSFRIGCVYTIVTKLEQDRKSTETGSQAIVLMNRRFAEATAFCEKMRKLTKHNSQTKIDNFAYIHGVSAADEVQLRKGVGKGESTTTLSLGSGD